MNPTLIERLPVVITDYTDLGEIEIVTTVLNPHTGLILAASCTLLNRSHPAFGAPGKFRITGVNRWTMTFRVKRETPFYAEGTVPIVATFDGIGTGSIRYVP